MRLINQKLLEQLVELEQLVWGLIQDLLCLLELLEWKHL